MKVVLARQYKHDMVDTFELAYLKIVLKKIVTIATSARSKVSNVACR